MLEILWKGLFFLSMLVLYANITSITLTIGLVIGFIVCVSSYYYSNRIRNKIDEFLNSCTNDAHFFDPMYPTPTSIFLMNRRFNKINNNRVPVIEGGELPSPILKNNPPVRSKTYRDKLKMTFNPKDLNRKNIQGFNLLNPSRRYNTNLDLETYMNVNSPGFTSRVVDKVTESSSGKYSTSRHQSYKFDKSSLRQLSKIPRANSTPVVRIAAPEMTREFFPSENNFPENIENVRSNSILQVLKDMSRKRNYSQEETDRTGSTPKKSKKSEIRNMAPQYKRTHEDCSNDSIEDERRKKRCDESDNKIAKMMSYTSGMSVLALEDFTWNSQPKKRKSSRLEKSKNESPEKSEKFRRISEKTIQKESVPKVIVKRENKINDDVDESEVMETKAEPVLPNKKEKNIIEETVDSTDSSFIDEDSDYVHIAGGKILNRTNCLYRRKLNSSKIDPVSVINPEPDYATASSNDDDNLKQSLLNNLINDIERNGERNDSVIFYQNSIVEEVAKHVVTEVEVHQPDFVIHTSSTINPLIPPTTKPAVTASVQFNFPSSTISASKSEPLRTTSQDLSTLPAAQISNPLLTRQSNEFKIGARPLDTVDAPKHSESSQNIQDCTPAISAAGASLTSTVESTSVSTSAVSTPSINFNVTSSASVPITPKSIVTTVESATNSSNTGFIQPKISSSAFTPTTTSVSAFSKIPSGGFAFGKTSELSGNPLLNQTPSKTSESVSEKTPVSEFASTAPANSTSATPKILMFGNTMIASTTPATQPTNSVFSSIAFGATTANTIPTTSPTTTNPLFTSIAQPVTTSAAAVAPAPSFAFGQSTAAETTKSSNNSAFTFGQSSSSGGFQFGSPAATKADATTTNNSSVFKSGFLPSTAVTTAPVFGTSFINTTTTAANSTPAFTVTPSVTSGKFSFGSQKSESTFDVNAAQPSPFGGGTQTASKSQSNLFGGLVNNTSGSTFSAGTTQPSTFGTGQTSSVFGSATGQNATTVFGAVNTAAAPTQGSLFGAAQPSQPVVFGSTQSVGAGDSTTSTVFGQTQNQPNNQTTSTFNFGNNQPTPTFGSASAGFGGTEHQRSFGSSSTFNFNGGTTNAFANNSNPAFGAAAAPLPVSNNLFNFGTNTAAPTQTSAFQFGAAAPTAGTAQPSQTFTFGAGAAAPAPATGGFSIGTGSTVTRNRPMAKSRRPK